MRAVWTERQRREARRKTVRAAFVALENRERIHYTQGPRRWEGINLHKRAYRGEYPRYADCSAFATWCLWDGTLLHKPHDFVNGAQWRAGYTGTQVQHGKRVEMDDLLPGDLVFYGGGSIPAHVAVYVGKGRVISHGSEAGPYLLPVRYREVNQARRYIR